MINEVAIGDREYVRVSPITIEVYYRDGVVDELLYNLVLDEHTCDNLMEDLYYGEYDGG
jgi:hypothetical protein